MAASGSPAGRALAGLGQFVAAILLVALFALAATQARASADPSEICHRVAQAAADQTGVPMAVLMAISLTETGRKRDGAFRPWPWTVNMEGKGLWFDTQDEARAYVYREYQRGARSFDVGCFQINYRWHGEEFASIDEMFDPMANALYAARLLRDLYAGAGTWSLAAGSYHSRTPEYAERYRARFDRIIASLGGAGGDPTPPGGSGDRAIPEIPDIVLAASGASGGEPADGSASPRRVNRFPLLLAGGTGGLGSLVPIDGDAAAAPPGESDPASPGDDAVSHDAAPVSAAAGRAPYPGGLAGIPILASQPGTGQRQPLQTGG